MAEEKETTSAAGGKPAKSPAQDGGKKKGKGLLVFFIVLLLLIGGGAAVWFFDIGGLRENAILPYLRNAPIIGGFFPPAEEAEPEPTPEELRQRLTILQQQLESVQAQLALANEQVSTLTELTGHLRAFEAAWQLYREARSVMEQMIAHGDPVNFAEFFGFVSEDNLVRLYIEALEMGRFLEETEAIVSTLNGMDEAGAGQVLETLMTTDTQLMIRALRKMSPGRRAEIFDTLEAGTVTTMLLLMSPPEPEIEPMLPPYLPEFPPLMATIPDGWDVLFGADFWADFLRGVFPPELVAEAPDWLWEGLAQEMAMEMTDYFESGEALDRFVAGMLDYVFATMDESPDWQEFLAEVNADDADEEEAPPEEEE